MSEIRKIAVFTSGGDAPGMNAAVRAVVRTSLYYKREAYGIYRGYDGMISGHIEKMKSQSVSNIIQRGGTILKSARSKEFMTPEGREKAYQNLKREGIDGIVAIGGDGTFSGALVFSTEYGIPIIGIPGTIDNDLAGTDYTLGFDTATNTAVEAIDKIRDTASSHNRLFFIEVMGRDAGFIAVQCALAAGAEAVVIPEKKMTVEELVAKLEDGSRRNKTSSLVIVAEGGKSGSAIELAKQVTEKFGHYDARVTILGHLQRGGTPSCFDRVLAGRFGVAAVEALLAGKTDMTVGIKNTNIALTHLSDAIKLERDIDDEVFRISEILSI